MSKQFMSTEWPSLVIRRDEKVARAQVSAVSRSATDDGCHLLLFPPPRAGPVIGSAAPLRYAKVAMKRSFLHRVKGRPGNGSSQTLFRR